MRMVFVCDDKLEVVQLGTVNLEIFEGFISRNFAYAKFHENKILAKS